MIRHGEYPSAVSLIMLFSFADTLFPNGRRTQTWAFCAQESKVMSNSEGFEGKPSIRIATVSICSKTDNGIK